MDGKINADLKSLKIIYARNKYYVVPMVAMLVCIFIFFQFLIPQFRALLEVRQEAREASLTLEMLKEDLNILNNLDEDTLDSQLSILNSALPLNKDYSGILNSIYYTSQKTGVGLGAFSLRIGDLAVFDSKDNFPNIKLTLPINSGVGAISSFVETISNVVPLSEVSFVKVSGVGSTIDLSFYYKPLDIPNNGDIDTTSISQKGILLIDKLKDFGGMSSVSSSIPVATSSSL